ncbi:MAG TPA: acyltransferase [Anaerolineaceae bacterium]|nr:acyltransferase [Anaerolineaceae bacterium]
MNARESQLGVLEKVKESTRPMVGTRLAYVDAIRTVLIILVIMVHAAVTYGSLGDWTYEDPRQDELSAVLLSFFVIACQAFFMGLYFFLSGIFTPQSYERKGVGAFWKDRLLRLGIPMVVYTWGLAKLPNYINDIANEGLQMSFGRYFVARFWAEADEGPTWFIFALLVFTLGYTLWRLVTHRAQSSWVHHVPAPSMPILLMVGFVMALLTFSVAQVLPIGQMYDVFGIFSLQLQFFPTYIILFIAGVLAYRNDWLTQLPQKQLRFWAWFSAGLLVTLPAMLLLGGAAEDHLDEFMTGLNPRCVAMSLWLGFACIAFSMTVTLWMRSIVRPGNPFARFCAPNNYAVYLIHPLVLVPITLGLSSLSWIGLGKFALASVFTVMICYAFANLLRKVPGMKQVL